MNKCNVNKSNSAHRKKRQNLNSLPSSPGRKALLAHPAPVLQYAKLVIKPYSAFSATCEVPIQRMT